MKTINTLLRLFFFLAIVMGVTLIGCKKEVSNNLTPQQQKDFATTAAQSDADASVVFDDVFDNVMGVNSVIALGNTGVFGNSYISSYSSGITSNSVTDINIPHCFTVAITHLNSSSFFPVRVVIDFGDSCTGLDGRTRKGKIITEYTGRLINPGSKATTTFDGYFINNLQVGGSHVVENISTPDSRTFHVQVTDAQLTKPNGNFIQWNRDITISQIQGLGTPLWPLDDVLSITGQANGAAKKDSIYYQWSNIITDALIKKFACHWLVQGKVEIKRGSQDAAILDYGSGECDNKATLTVNGSVYEITLH